MGRRLVRRDRPASGGRRRASRLERRPVSGRRAALSTVAGRRRAPRVRRHRCGRLRQRRRVRVDRLRRRGVGKAPRPLAMACRVGRLRVRSGAHARLAGRVCDDRDRLRAVRRGLALAAGPVPERREEVRSAVGGRGGRRRLPDPLRRLDPDRRRGAGAAVAQSPGSSPAGPGRGGVGGGIPDSRGRMDNPQPDRHRIAHRTHTPGSILRSDQPPPRDRRTGLVAAREYRPRAAERRDPERCRHRPHHSRAGRNRGAGGGAGSGSARSSRAPPRPARVRTPAPHGIDRRPGLRRRVRALSGGVPAAHRRGAAGQIPAAAVSAVAGRRDDDSGRADGQQGRQGPPGRRRSRYVVVAGAAGGCDLRRRAAMAGRRAGRRLPGRRLLLEAMDRVGSNSLSEREPARRRRLVDRPAGALFSYRPPPARGLEPHPGRADRAAGRSEPRRVDLGRLVRRLGPRSRLRRRRRGCPARRGTGGEAGRWQGIPGHRRGRRGGPHGGIRHPRIRRRGGLLQGALHGSRRASRFLPARDPGRRRRPVRSRPRVGVLLQPPGFFFCGAGYHPRRQVPRGGNVRLRVRTLPHRSVPAGPPPVLGNEDHRTAAPAPPLSAGVPVGHGGRLWRPGGALPLRRVSGRPQADLRPRPVHGRRGGGAVLSARRSGGPGRPSRQPRLYVR